MSTFSLTISDKQPACQHIALCLQVILRGRNRMKVLNKAAISEPSSVRFYSFHGKRAQGATFAKGKGKRNRYKVCGTKDSTHNRKLVGLWELGSQS